MIRLTLMSIVLALVALPLLAGRDPLPMRGLKRAVLRVVAFNAFYVLFVRVVLPRLT